MIKAIPAYWTNHPNFGDALTPYLIERITGLPAVWTNQKNEPKYMVTGSMLNDPLITSCVVWGTGIAFSDTSVKKPLQVCAVRGPISREIIMRDGHACPEIYGDPGLLLPRFYQPGTPQKQFKLGIIPHIVDYLSARLKYSDTPNVSIIDLLSPVEQVVNRIAECDMLISSSLHGIIVSHAYGKPCAWVEFSDNVIGNGTKFRDYLQSVGHDVYEPLDLKQDIMPIDWILKNVPQNTNLNIDLGALWQACPFKEE